MVRARVHTHTQQYQSFYSYAIQNSNTHTKGTTLFSSTLTLVTWRTVSGPIPKKAFSLKPVFPVLLFLHSVACSVRKQKYSAQRWLVFKSFRYEFFVSFVSFLWRTKGHKFYETVPIATFLELHRWLLLLALSAPFSITTQRQGGTQVVPKKG